MGAADRKQFTDAVAARRTGLLTEDWKPAILALNGLAMFDILPALAAVGQLERDSVERIAPSVIGASAAKRIMFANVVVKMREIPDWTGSVSLDQINDAREYLGCTRLDDAEVRKIIDDSIKTAGVQLSRHPDFARDACCGVIGFAWTRVLVPQRQKPGASLIAN